MGPLGAQQSAPDSPAGETVVESEASAASVAVLGYGSSYTVKASDYGHTLYVWVEGYGSTTGSCTSAITAPVGGGSVTTLTDLGW